MNKSINLETGENFNRVVIFDARARERATQTRRALKQSRSSPRSLFLGHNGTGLR